MNFIILADPSDETALRAGLLLRQRHGPERVHIRTADELVLAHWDHRITSEGVVNAVGFHDGTCVTNAGPTIIFNRLNGVHPPLFESASPANREYARMEIFALLLSWLASDQHRVINPPSAALPPGGVLRPFVWQHLAMLSGFVTLNIGATTSTRRFPPTRALLRPDMSVASDPYADLNTNRFTWYSRPLPASSVSALVIGEDVIGDVPKEVASACVRLAKRACLDLLRIHLAFEDDAQGSSATRATFLDADANPAVHSQEELLHLVTYLETARVVAREAHA
jgi:hypothetical protein